MTVYAQPGSEGAKVAFESRYDNYIGGDWVKPVKGNYFENITPVTGKAFTEVAPVSYTHLTLPTILLV